MAYEVTVKETADLQVAALRVHVSLETVGDEVQAGFGTLMRVVGEQGATTTGPPFIIMHEVIDEEASGDIEMCIPVAQPITDDGDVVSRVVAGGPVAATIHKGRYHEIGPAYHALSTWISGHGHSFAGPPRETYLNDPTEVGESDQVTEVAWPIDPSG